MKAKPTVFVIDDEPPILNSLRMLMKPFEWNVRTYSSARGFLDAFEYHARACLVLDVRLPGMNGLELQQQLRSRGIHIPVIIITGHGDVAVAVQCMKAGALDYFEKPFDGEALLRCIRQAIEYQEQAGILTRVTKQLTPKEACELFREIAPRLVLGILEHLDQSVNVGTARRIADHMCQADVQNRLRNGEHVRDKIVDELCRILNGSDIKQRLDRKTLLGIIERSGVMKDLITMEACCQRIGAA